MSKPSLILAGILAVALVALAIVPDLRRPSRAPSHLAGTPVEAAEAESVLSSSSQGRRNEARPDPAAADRSLTVLVIDEDDLPVREVQVFSSLGESGARPLGVTGSAGVVTCAPIEAPFSLVASGEDIQTREMLVEREAPLVRMIVRRGASLSGRVVCSGSEQPAPSRVRVVAWPNSWRVPPSELARRVLEADPRALATTADVDGSFELRGLAPDTPYDVVAVAPGWCVWPPVVLEASANNVVRMGFVLGIRATVRELGDRSLDVPPLRAYGRRVPIEDLALRGARYVPRPNPIAELSGWGAGPESGDPTRMELLFTSPEELTMLGPIAFELDIPGYLRESVDLWALPTDQGISERTIEALPSGESRRELRLDLEGIPSQASGRLAIRGKIGQIVLVDPDQERRFVDLCDLSSTAIVLPDVPRSLRFEGVHLNAENPTSLPCELASVTEELETWKVELSAFQAITVELRQPDDSLYLGPAIFLTGPSEEELGGLICFERGPFVLLSARASGLCVFVFEPESIVLAPEAAVAARPAARQASIGWH